MSGQYNIGGGRTPDQIAKMEKLQAVGICAFCPEHFAKYHDNPIDFETDHWIVAPNDYPYEHTSLHLLVIAREHVRSLGELTAQARQELAEVVARVERDRRLGSYAYAMRNGDPRYNGSSVEHLHGHIIVGERDPDKFGKVRFKVSSLPQEETT